ncbi:aldehyde dehydrogenase family protein [Streptomyces sp. NPDC047453]|uniref:aldehyde dehydrogenase family protein n=1 Tax=Streptomyces sp. NPDC047453 TaxID=3154812 RepID=UPI003406F605
MKLDAVSARGPGEAALIPPTILTDVPADAKINEEEVFGPVISSTPTTTSPRRSATSRSARRRCAPTTTGRTARTFRAFVRGATSGGVTRNDCFAHQTVPGAPFGGVGHSGYGAYHGKAGFDEFTHRRTVAAPEGDRPFAAGSTGEAVLHPDVETGLDQFVAGEVAALRSRLGR